MLVQLTDAPDGKARVFALADRLHWEQSRLSHQLARMARRGLVAREECSTDGRGAFIVTTEAGRAAIEAAAPGHVEEVRALVVDPLGPAGMASLQSLSTTMLAALDAAGSA